MSAVDKNIERRIVRYLDGELNADEELELNREILRDPEAHRLLEEYRRIDELSAAVLELAVPPREPGIDRVALKWPRRSRRLRRSHFAWWLLPGAMAAALVVAVMTGPGSTPAPRQHALSPQPQSLPKVDSTPVPMNGSNGLQHRVSDMEPRRRVIRDVTRNIFGVLGEDGSIYWIEVDQIRTIKRPNTRAASKAPVEEL